MAAGVRQLLDSTVAVASTGEAGPQSGSGQPVGTVHIAVSGPQGERTGALHLNGDRATIQAASTVAALELLAEVLGETLAVGLPDSSRVSEADRPVPVVGADGPRLTDAARRADPNG